MQQEINKEQDIADGKVLSEYYSEIERREKITAISFSNWLSSNAYIRFKDDEYINIRTKELKNIEALYDECVQEIDKRHPNEQPVEQKEWDSKRIIGRVKDRFKELIEKGWDWRGFYNGWLEGRADMLAQIKGLGQYKPEQKEKLKSSDWDYYIPVMTNIQNRTGISIEWQELWSEIENWYGDIKKKETGEEFLKRMQATYFQGEQKEGVSFDSKWLIGRSEERFKELESYKWEWRSFYNGWLEGRMDAIESLIKRTEQKENEAVAFVNWLKENDKISLKVYNSRLLPLYSEYQKQNKR